MTRGSMGQELRGRQRALLPEVQWVLEGPILQDDPGVPAMKENYAGELAQHLCSEQMWLCAGMCNGCNLKSTEELIPKF